MARNINTVERACPGDPARHNVDFFRAWAHNGKYERANNVEEDLTSDDVGSLAGKHLIRTTRHFQVRRFPTISFLLSFKICAF